MFSVQTVITHQQGGNESWDQLAQNVAGFVSQDGKDNLTHALAFLKSYFPHSSEKEIVRINQIRSVVESLLNALTSRPPLKDRNSIRNRAIALLSSPI